MKEQELKKDHLIPGQMVSAYNYISQSPGRLYHKKVKSNQYEMFLGGCVFKNPARGYASIKHQVAINATKIVKSKLTLEREDKSQGVMINVYHTDNETFNTSKFMEEMLEKQ